MARIVELNRGYPALFQFATELGVELAGRFRAACPEEIEEIRRLAGAYNGARLPEDYVEFLRVMGGANRFATTPPTRSSGRRP